MWSREERRYYKGALVPDTTERWPLKTAVEAMTEQLVIKRLKIGRLKQLHKPLDWKSFWSLISKLLV